MSKQITRPEELPDFIKIAHANAYFNPKQISNPTEDDRPTKVISVLDFMPIRTAQKLGFQNHGKGVFEDKEGAIWYREGDYLKRRISESEKENVVAEYVKKVSGRKIVAQASGVPYVGLKEGNREVFFSNEEPTQESHGHLYNATIGPFKTYGAARVMVEWGGNNNPHLTCVNDAEKVAKWYGLNRITPEQDSTPLEDLITRNKRAQTKVSGQYLYENQTVGEVSREAKINKAIGYIFKALRNDKSESLKQQVLEEAKNKFDIDEEDLVKVKKYFADEYGWLLS